MDTNGSAGGPGLRRTAIAADFTLVHSWLGRVGVSAACLYVTDGLAHLHLDLLRFALVLAALALVLGLATRCPARWWRGCVQGGAVALAVFLCSTGLHLGISVAQAGYFAVLLQCVLGLLLVLEWRVIEFEGRTWPETWRVLAAGGIGLAVVAPFATDHFAGGTDARWYGMVMVDYIKQERAGVFPIFNGQSDFAFNGGIHPYRTAPLHLWLGALLDLLTGRSLSSLALQHLTVILTSVAASLGMYLALTTLAPLRRKTAVVVAIIFATCPGQLAAIYTSEAYMTFMTFPGLVAVMYGNLLSLGSNYRAGWWWLTAGLGYTWMAHPSVGAVAILITAALQVGWAFAHGPSWRQTRAGVLAAGIFGALILAYVVALREAMLPVAGNSRVFGPTVLGGFLLLAGIWLVEQRRSVRGWGCLLLGAVLLACVRRALGIYAATVIGLEVLVFMAWRTNPCLFLPRLAWLRVFILAILATGVAGVFVGRNFEGEYISVAGSLEVARDELTHIVGLVPADGLSAGSFQPGAEISLLFFIAGLGAWKVPALRQRVLAVVAVFVLFLYLPLPYFAEFFWGNLPPEILTLTSVAFDRRLLPVLATVGAFAGFGGWCVLGRRALGQLTLYLAIALLPLSLWEAGKFVRVGWNSRNSWAATKTFYRAENDALGRYPYDLLTIPPYVSHGFQDYRLESRILEPGNFAPRFGPQEYAKILERDSGLTLLLNAKAENATSPWLLLSPPLEVPPQADWIFRHEFLATPPEGYLLMIGQAGLYREYILPSSGYGQSFGAAPPEHGVVPWHNGTDAVDRCTWELKRIGKFSATEGEGVFARVHVSRYDGSRLPVEMTSLIPYRAEVRLEKSGWLETFRCWVPGYSARVDGSPVAPEKSPHELVMLPVPAGNSRVELLYVGTPALWLAMGVSSFAALWMLVSGFFRWRLTVPFGTVSAFEES